MSEQTQNGIAALKAGNRATAKQLLGSAVKQDPNDLQAWLWLSGAVDRDEERIVCLQQVLRIDPGNQAAARGLSQVMAKQTSQVASSPVTVEISAKADSEPPSPEPIAASSTQIESTAEQSTKTLPPIETISATDNRSQSFRNRFFRRRSANVIQGQIIFRTRPSVVPALLCFWLFLFSTIAMTMLIGSVSLVDYVLPIGLGVVLEFIVLYVAVRNLRTRYILSSETLSLPYRGKKVVIALEDIMGTETEQSFFQKIIGIGSLTIDGAVDNELAHLLMRDIPDIKRRASQLKELLADQD